MVDDLAHGAMCSGIQSRHLVLEVSFENRPFLRESNGHLAVVSPIINVNERCTSKGLGVNFSHLKGQDGTFVCPMAFVKVVMSMVLFCAADEQPGPAAAADGQPICAVTHV